MTLNVVFELVVEFSRGKGPSGDKGDVSERAATGADYVKVLVLRVERRLAGHGGEEPGAEFGKAFRSAAKGSQGCGRV